MNRFLSTTVSCFVVLGLFAVTYFCTYYYTTGYDTLRDWFFSLNGCFYKQDAWATNFFTPAAKEKGDKLALAAVFMVASLVVYFATRWRSVFKLNIVAASTSNKQHRKWQIAVIVLATASGLYSWSLMAPAYDEVFSAVNCAQLHPFQTIAYYMLPNNHMYFNFLNNVLFSWWWHDQIYSGRLISFIAYVGSLLQVFNWLNRIIKNPLAAYLGLLPVALQFTVWAMSAQARAYSFELCCAWGAFVAIWHYTEEATAGPLRWLGFFTIAGFALMPAYLSIYVAQMLFMLAIMTVNRKIDWRFLRYQAVAVAIIFLLYVPGFCFSGIAAFTENGYVTPTTNTVQEFLPAFTDTLRYFINFCFSMIGGEDNPFNFTLFLLPLVLFFSRKTGHRLLATFYLLLWLVYTGLTLYFRRNPFNRNMIVHYSYTMALVSYTLYVVIAWLCSIIRVSTPKIAIAIFAFPMLVYAAYLCYCNGREVSFCLYYNDVNAINKQLRHDMTIIPAGASVGCSNESFYYYYLLKGQHYNVHKCAEKTEQYYIKNKEEPLDDVISTNYIKILDGNERFEFYRHK